MAASVCHKPGQATRVNCMSLFRLTLAACPGLWLPYVAHTAKQTYGNQTENFRWKGSSGWILSPPAYQKPEIKIKDEEVENEESYKGATKIK